MAADPIKVTFDKSYRNLFQVDNPRLRADALQHSAVPRLRHVLYRGIALVKEIYDVEPLADSRDSWWPRFRKQRTSELQFLYEAAYAGLGGKQGKDKWHGFQRKDGKEVQLLPFRYGLLLDGEGLRIFFENHWLKGLTDASHRKLFDFHISNESLIHALGAYADIYEHVYWEDGIEPISALKTRYLWMANHGNHDNHFLSNAIEYPISSEKVDAGVARFAMFYPVYDSYIRIAMRLPVRFSKLVGKLNQWFKRQDELNEVEKPISRPAIASTLATHAKRLAEQKINVMPALRWQVFSRDGWKCVSCGRTSHDNIILHMDHILPRSKGGKDSLENLQTLCDRCNLGKGNRDQFDLRRK